MIKYGEPTIHQQARTDLLNSYGKYFTKQMYAELWNYTQESEQIEKELNELKEVVMEFLIADGQIGNDQVLKAIKSLRTLRTMLGMEGDNHGEKTQANLFNDH